MPLQVVYLNVEVHDELLKIAHSLRCKRLRNKGVYASGRFDDPFDVSRQQGVWASP